MKRQHIVVLIALGIVGAALAFMSITTGGVGTVTTTDEGITRVYSKARADQSVRVDLRLLEGSGLEHESSHIFETLEGYAGIEEATILFDGPTIEVEFASAEVSAESIRGALASSGYAVTGQP